MALVGGFTAPLRGGGPSVDLLSETELSRFCDCGGLALLGGGPGAGWSDVSVGGAGESEGLTLEAKASKSTKGWLARAASLALLILLLELITGFLGKLAVVDIQKCCRVGGLSGWCG